MGRSGRRSGSKRHKQTPSGVRLAPHYGCRYLKPSELTAGFDSPEVPRTLAAMMEAIGAEVIDYPTLTECCGGGILGMSEEVANAMARKKLKEVSRIGVHAVLVLVCPFAMSCTRGNKRKSVETQVLI